MRVLNKKFLHGQDSLLAPDMTIYGVELEKLWEVTQVQSTYILLSDSAELTCSLFGYPLYFCHKDYSTSSDRILKLKKILGRIDNLKNM